MAGQALSEIPPTSPVWSLITSAGPFIARLGKIARQLEAADAYLERVSQEHPDKWVQADALFLKWQTAHHNQDVANAKRYHQRLLSEFGDTHYAKRLEMEYDPKRAIVKGKPIPSFSFVSMEDSTQSISNQSLLGKNYLIDFWGRGVDPA